jgi:membrane protein YdbS with pleckstrin-like domain
VNTPVHSASRWVYRGLWGVLSGLFRVPKEPPALPALGGHQPTSFQPARGFLTYLTIQFWIGAMFLGGLCVFGLLGITAGNWRVGLTLAAIAIPCWLVGVAIAYLAIHLRYDTTWYVVSDRSLRIRRGIWIIRETTLTFENVQNVVVQQGPLQRFCGIANVVVETAGGGGGAAGAHGGNQSQAAASHQGLIEGIADAVRIRDLLLARLRQSRSAGLGDESEREEASFAFSRHASHHASRPVWSAAHLAALREIRDELVGV